MKWCAGVCPSTIETMMSSLNSSCCKMSSSHEISPKRPKHCSADYSPRILSGGKFFLYGKCVGVWLFLKYICTCTHTYAWNAFIRDLHEKVSHLLAGLIELLSSLEIRDFKYVESCLQHTGFLLQKYAYSLWVRDAFLSAFPMLVHA